MHRSSRCYQALLQSIKSCVLNNFLTLDVGRKLFCLSYYALIFTCKDILKAKFSDFHSVYQVVRKAQYCSPPGSGLRAAYHRFAE